MPMSALSPAIVEASRKTERMLLQTLAERSQVKVAESMGVSESTVSRIDKAAIAAFIAACGLKVLAGVGLRSAEPKTLDWGDQ